MSLKLFTYPGNYRANKGLIAAQYAGVKVDVPAFEMGKDNKSAEFLKKNPLGKVPTLETPQGCIFESNAIARYIARLRSDSGLFGTSAYQAGVVDQWIDFSANELEAPAGVWIYPILGYMKYDQKANEAARADVHKALNILNEHLKLRTFIVGNSVTLADIAVVCGLLNLYKMVLDAGVRAQYQNVTRWFETCVNQPQFSAVLGKVELCQQEQVAADAKGKAAKKEEKKEAKKEEKPKEEKKPKEEEPAEEDYEDKPKNKELSEDDKWAMKPSKMVLDDVKRLFSNNPLDVALPQFYENFDHEVYTVFEGAYNYNSENRVFFMTCNLLGGFIQRLEELRKTGFGSLVIYGKDESTPPYNMTTVFVFKAPHVPQAMKECPDSEYYTWKQLDMKSAEGKARFEEILGGATVDGQAVLERRLFK